MTTSVFENEVNHEPYLMGPEKTMYTAVIESGLTYGQAMDAAIHGGMKVTRAIWKGYWELRSVEGLTEPILVAVLRGNQGITTATAYGADKLATDWMTVLC